MVIQLLVVTGSIWIGKRIYDDLTRPSPSIDSATGQQTVDGDPGTEPLPEQERVACRNLAVAGSGLTLAVGSMLGSGLLALLTIPVLGSAFFPLIRNGWGILRSERRINYGLFISVIIAGSLAAGYLVLTAVLEAVYFGSEVLLAKTRRRTRETLTRMFDDWPAVAWVRSGDAEISMPLVELAPGDIVVVRAGETIPVDGTVVAGAGGVDQSTVTGESVVAETTLGDKVFGSTFLLNGHLDIRVDQAGSHTLAGQIADVLDRVESFEASVENRGVKIADASVNPTLAVGAIAWAARGPMVALAVGASNFADTERLASPLSVLNYLRVMAAKGIRVKDGRSLELLGDVDTVVFDKTGTLTMDRLTLVVIRAVEGWSEHQILGLAASAEQRQQHPIAVAIRETAATLQLSVPPGVTVTNSIGNGIVARVEGSSVLVGSHRYLNQEDIAIPVVAAEEETVALEAGRTVVHVARNRQWVGQIIMEASVRPEVADVIAGFRRAGYGTAILSGDHAGPTQRLAETLGIDDWRAGVLPQEKTAFIKDLQARGHSVCFVGDGINDGMALKAANVSVTLNDASAVATDAAQIVLQQGSLSELRPLFELSKRFRSDRRIMRSTMIVNSTLSASSALFLGLPVSVPLFMYLGTIVAGGVIAVSPLWRHGVSPDAQSISTKRP